ncbi:MAG: protein phosphatase 2C domain-containing protein [Acholeplasma sp.]|nr:protein phosphatase 2C domain-containing protein [Acholeplasma sp.]
MKIRYQNSIPYRDYNEDGIYHDGKLYIVFDGATALYQQGNNKSSMASEMIDYLINEIRNTSFKDLDDLFYQLSIKAANNFNYRETETAKLPSASVAAVLINNDYIHTYLLGDCRISYQKTDGKIVHLINDQRLVNLDNSVKKELKELMKKYSFSEARNMINKQLIDNRNQANKENGYAVFMPSNYPMFYSGAKKRIKRDEVENIKIYSDGYYSARDTFNLYKNQDDLFKEEPKVVIEKIKDVAFSDKEIKKYPRFKIIDDISIIELVKK